MERLAKRSPTKPSLCRRLADIVEEKYLSNVPRCWLVSSVSIEIRCTESVKRKIVGFSENN